MTAQEETKDKVMQYYIYESDKDKGQSFTDTVNGKEVTWQFREIREGIHRSPVWEYRRYEMVPFVYDEMTVDKGA